MWKKPDEIVNCKSFTFNFLLNFFLIKRVSHIQIFLNHYFSALSLEQTIFCLYSFFLSLNFRWFMTRFTIHSFYMFLTICLQKIDFLFWLLFGNLNYTFRISSWQRSSPTSIVKLLENFHTFFRRLGKSWKSVHQLSIPYLIPRIDNVSNCMWWNFMHYY